MPFFDKIKRLISPSNPKTLQDFDLHLDDTTQANDGAKYHLNDANKIITIFLANLLPREKKLLQKVIKEEFEAGMAILLEESKVDLIDRLYKYDNKDDEKILSFFQSILSKPDWEALRDALFLRNEFKLHHDISGLKLDIIKRYGERGNTISNLCTAGYFEETMIPLYNQSSVEFHKYYDIAVNRNITALFVNATMSVAKIGIEIKQRLNSAKAYGLKKMDIHGIGKGNTKKIYESIEKEKDRLGFIVKNIFTDKNLNVCVVEIIF